MIKKISEILDDENFLKADGFDNAVIGFDTNSMRLIYSITKCYETLIAQGMDLEEAIEYFDFNVYGADMGEKTPIWCYDKF